jgi:hypothetical protein
MPTPAASRLMSSMRKSNRPVVTSGAAASDGAGADANTCFSSSRRTMVSA